MAWLRLIVKDFATEIADSLYQKHAGMHPKDKQSPPLSIWIPGNPATFATAGEKSWKEQLLNSIPPSYKDKAYGLELRFYLRTLKPHRQPLDVDNLCEPVFSVLVNQLGWLEGKRQNIQWWCASKTESQESGLHLSIFSELSADLNIGTVNLTPVFNDVYGGPMPKSATDPCFYEWLESKVKKANTNNNYAVLIRFGNPHINLGDISTGKIKALVDGLFPLIGGSAGRPEDWRIKTLAVDKGKSGLKPDSVSVTVWEAFPD